MRPSKSSAYTYITPLFIYYENQSYDLVGFVYKNLKWIETIDY